MVVAAGEGPHAEHASQLEVVLALVRQQPHLRRLPSATTRVASSVHGRLQGLTLPGSLAASALVVRNCLVTTALSSRPCRRALYCGRWSRERSPQSSTGCLLHAIWARYRLKTDFCMLAPRSPMFLLRFTSGHTHPRPAPRSRGRHGPLAAEGEASAPGAKQRSGRAHPLRQRPVASSGPRPAEGILGPAPPTVGGAASIPDPGNRTSETAK